VGNALREDKCHVAHFLFYYEKNKKTNKNIFIEKSFTVKNT